MSSVGRKRNDWAARVSQIISCRHFVVETHERTRVGWENWLEEPHCGGRNERRRDNQWQRYTLCRLRRRSAFPRGCYSRCEETFQLQSNVPDRLPSALRILFEAALENLSKSRMQLRGKLRVIRIACQYRCENVGHHIAAKHRTACQHFV